MKIGRLVILIAACVVVAASAHSAEYRLERRGDALAAFADGRRFAMLSPAECGDWKIDADVSDRDFIRFVFTPKTGVRSGERGMGLFRA